MFQKQTFVTGSRDQGIHVQRSKVRKAIHDLDPSVTIRKRTAIQAVRKYGRPRRIRSDHEGEETLVWRDMNSTWGEDARPVIVGSSVHDQRIERHNRSANKQELSIFKSEFYDLKRDVVLDPLNETDLFCLHHVCLPRLNKNLSEFVCAHNNH